MTDTAREGRDEVVEFVTDSTAQLHHITEWAPDAVADAQECGLAGGGEGAAYGYDQWAPRGEDPVADAERIAEYWESLGMSVRTTDPNGSPSVYAEGGPVLRASFSTRASGETSTSPDRYNLGAVMPCGTGDAYTLNIEDQARRDAGETLPGDEGVIPWEDKQASATPTPSPTATD